MRPKTTGPDMPVLTLAEIDATARKAARGHGCPWGLAEEAGKSARWLASHGLPGAESLAGMLGGRARCCTESGAPCALRLGAALADRAAALGAEPVVTGTAGHPLLVLAQMGRAADALDRAFALEWEGGGARVSRHALAIHGTPGGASLACSGVPGAVDGPPPSPGSRPVGDDAWAALNALSRRILVPASAVSRAGAGSDTGDSD